MMMFANSTINPMMAKSLCEHGADPSAFQRSRGSALIMAVNAGELEMVKILLNAGASQEPVAVYKNYNPALHDEMGVEIGPVKWISAKLAAKQAHHENSQDIIAVLNAFEQVKTLDQQVPGSCEKAMPPRVRL
jgi:ankyrin repeat protein